MTTIPHHGVVNSQNRVRLIIIESPYAGDVARNMAYAHECVRDCLNRGESPYASHIMLTTATDDTIPEQRRVGIDAGLCWATRADAIAVYTDHGITPGMAYAINVHTAAGRTIEYRSLMGKD